MTSAGGVYLVGSGIGCADLLTVRAHRILGRADVVIHDRLIPDGILDIPPAHARRIDVGKRPGSRRWTQSRINTLLIDEARRARIVVRLKGGDAFVFGRGGEECRALAAAGVRYEIVPGISSAIAAPAFAGIPVTHRGTARTFTVVAGRTHEDAPDTLDWGLLAATETLVILMGSARLARIARSLLDHGRAPRTPVAVISNAGTGRQRVIRDRLDTVAELAGRIRTPATIVVGEVARMADELAWFPSAPAGSNRHEAGRVA